MHYRFTDHLYCSGTEISLIQEEISKFGWSFINWLIDTILFWLDCFRVETFQIVCSASGGFPHPQFSWFGPIRHNGTDVVDSSAEVRIFSSHCHSVAETLAISERGARVFVKGDFKKKNDVELCYASVYTYTCIDWCIAQLYWPYKRQAVKQKIIASAQLSPQYSRTVWFFCESSL